MRRRLYGKEQTRRNPANKREAWSVYPYHHHNTDLPAEQALEYYPIKYGMKHL
jgi:hypothetical protein